MEMFSRRHGHSPERTELQEDSKDQDLLTALWNLVSETFWPELRKTTYTIHIPTPSSSFFPGRNPSSSNHNNYQDLLEHLWRFRLKQKIDEFPSARREQNDRIKEHFFNSEWYAPYDLIEEILSYYHGEFPKKESFIAECNNQLQEHKSPYQIINDLVTPIMEPEQVSTIKTALNTEQELVRSHLDNALRFLSHKTEPHYRHSINESMCAVESKLKTILGKDKVTVARGLAELRKKGLHPAFANGLNKLYGYAGGETRHAKRELHNDNPKNTNRTVGQKEARFMLILCSAFVSYLSTWKIQDDYK